MLNKILFALFISIFTIGFSFAQADIKFEKTEYDFGTNVEKDDTLWYSFTYKNIGNEPLVISDIKTACDCTLADWLKKPVMPGQTGVIKAGYKYKGKIGTYNKSLTIYANTTPAISYLTVKGVILESKK